MKRNFSLCSVVVLICLLCSFISVGATGETAEGAALPGLELDNYEGFSGSPWDDYKTGQSAVVNDIYKIDDAYSKSGTGNGLGIYALRADASDNETGQFRTGYALPCKLEAGKDYYFSAWYKLTTFTYASDLMVGVGFFNQTESLPLNNATNAIHMTTKSLTAADENADWRPISAIITPAEDIAAEDAILVLYLRGKHGNVLYFDDLEFGIVNDFLRVNDGSFEGCTNDNGGLWSVFNSNSTWGTNITVESEAYDDNKALKLTGSESGSANTRGVSSAKIFNHKAKDEFKFTFKVKDDQAVEKLILYDVMYTKTSGGSAARIGDARYLSTTNTGGWVQVTGYYTVPDDVDSTKGLYVVIRVKDQCTAYIDDVTLERGSAHVGFSEAETNIDMTVFEDAATVTPWAHIPAKDITMGDKLLFVVCTYDVTGSKMMLEDIEMQPFSVTDTANPIGLTADPVTVSEGKMVTSYLWNGSTLTPLCENAELIEQ